jgi:phenylalanyl-tRNA synthetase beta chain
VKSGAADEQALVRLRNPLSAELDVLRPTMLFGLLQSAAHNTARQQRDLRLFELGRVYRVVNGVSQEEDRLAFLITGRRQKESWRDKDEASSIADAKAEVDLLLQRFGSPKVELVEAEHPLLSAVLEWKQKDRQAARIGVVRPDVLKAFGLDQAAFYGELSADTWVRLLKNQRVKYAEVSRFPSVRRDLSLLLDKAVTFAQLETLARQSERKLLRTVDLFDVYEGDKLPVGKKSYALSFILQDAEKTLTDEQVEKAMGRIRQAFEKEAGAELRG